MGSEDQDLIVQSKKTRSSHHRSKYSHQGITLESLEIFLSTFAIHVMKEDIFARDCPKNKSSSHKKKGNKRRHHDHAAEDDEPSTKRTRYESENSSSDEEYDFIFALTGNITHGSNDWIIDSGASKHMIQRVLCETFRT